MGEGGLREYSYRLVDKNAKVGDYGVVEVRDNWSIARIVQIEDKPRPIATKYVVRVINEGFISPATIHRKEGDREE
jgi:hypothetical protein